MDLVGDQGLLLDQEAPTCAEGKLPVVSGLDSRRSPFYCLHGEQVFIPNSVILPVL